MSMRSSSPYGDINGAKRNPHSSSVHGSEYGGSSARNRMKKSGSMKNDVRVGSNTNIYRQSKAKEFESYKQLPRFTHANMAVIHPATKTTSMKPSVSTPQLDVGATPMTMRQRNKIESKLKVLPDHLIRAPMSKNTKKASRFVAAQQLLE